MELSAIKAGTKLELDILDISDDKEEKTTPLLVSQFEACVADQKAIIAAPIFEGNVLNLHNGTEMIVYFRTEGTGNNNIYAFRAVVTGREVVGNLHQLFIEQTSRLQKMQRRQFFRFKCNVDVCYRVITDDTENKDEFKKAITSDISGSGACILLNDKLAREDIVECEMSIGKDKKVRLRGRIVRCEDGNEDGKYKYIAGIEFTQIKNNDREAIVQFIYNEQRKLLKKGLIY